MRKAGPGRLIVESELYRRSHEPTEAQKRNGDYPKRAISWRGLTLKIENEAGSYRTFRGGMKRMIWPYGYVEGSTGVDGDEVDCFVGPNMDAEVVYVVHARRKGAWSEYDEDKCMLGFDSQEDAERAFLLSYDDPRFLGPVTAMTVAAFVEKVLATRDSPAMIKARPIIFWKPKTT